MRQRLIPVLARSAITVLIAVLSTLLLTPAAADAAFLTYDSPSYSYGVDANDAQVAVGGQDAPTGHGTVEGAERPPVPQAFGPSNDSSSIFVAPNLARFCSFSAETEVLMADGTTRLISEIEVGDWVIAQDPETGERGAREVTHLWVHQDTLIDLEIDGHDVATTEDHPFWNTTDDQWQRADALDAGDRLLSADGRPAYG